MSQASESTDREVEIEQEIDHDEYDPVGTLVLIFIYFLIIGALWIFMYFVEFLGRPTPMVV
ncbi:MAG: hypothetical protein ACI9K3_001170 [Halovenus sp.]|jgi:hypothetical protein